MFWVCLLSLNLFFLPAEAAGNPEVLTFKAWKNQQLTVAYAKIAKFHNEQKTSKARKTLVSIEKPRQENVSRRLHGTKRPVNELQEAHLGLEIARDFTVRDYITQYLSKFKNSQSAFSKLTPEMNNKEIVAILNAYNQIAKERLEELKWPESRQQESQEVAR